jgi:hypothetical protein
MGNTFEVFENSAEGTSRHDYACLNAADTFETAQNSDNSSSLKASGILPHLDIGGLERSITHGVASVAKDVFRCAGTVAKTAEHGAAEVAGTIMHIPARDWLDIGKAGLKVVQKEGTSLILDGVLVAKTKGTNLLSDAKLGLDLVTAATSPEGKDLAHKVAKAWADGEKEKERH